MEATDFPIPKNLEEIKNIFQQFELLIPEDKRRVVWETLNDIERNGGIRDEAHGRELLATLLNALNLGQL